MAVVSDSFYNLPSSPLTALLADYQRELQQQRASADPSAALHEALIDAESTALESFQSNAAALEFMSCSNSPFFYPSLAVAKKEQKLAYAMRILHTITKPSYNRYLKVVMLLLRELRFVILARDAQLFSRVAVRTKGQNATVAATEPCANMPGNTIVKLTSALQSVGSRRSYTAGQLLMQRSALGKNKNTPFAKALATRASELKNVLNRFLSAHLALRDAARVKVITEHFMSSTPSIDVTADVKKILDSTPAVLEFMRHFMEQLRECAARHEEDAQGSDVASLFRYLCDRARNFCTSLTRQYVHPFSSPKVDFAVLLPFLTSGGDPSGVASALQHVMDVVDQIETLAPDLCAMNYLLRLYGVDDAERYAHEVDVIDGTFKRLVGGVFEDESMEEEENGVALQVLVPHCCEVTGCDAATAQSWVTACLRATSDECSGEDTSPVWPANLPAPSQALFTQTPPQYRMVRSVHYHWNDVGVAQLPRLDGELDGVVYDARTRQVLFVLEAKHNIADVGKACKQKERLFSSLDAAWRLRSQPPPPPPPPPSGDAGKKAAPAMPTGPVELQFWVMNALEGRVAPTAAQDEDAERAETASARGPSTESDAREESRCSDEQLGDDEDNKNHAASPRTKKLVFTQDNFTSFFSAAPVLPVYDAAHPVPPPAVASAVDVSRERRWVYLTSLRVGEASRANTAAPAPGGEIYLVESVLVSAVGEAVADAYHHFAQSGRVPGGPNNSELKALFSSMEQSSFYLQCVQKKKGDAGMATVPLFHLGLAFPSKAQLAETPDTAAAPTNPYAYALFLWKNGVKLSDETTYAVAQVQMRSGFLNELRLSDRSLNFAIDQVAKRLSKRNKTTPSFCAVVKLLMDMHCVRNLVVVTSGA